MKFRRKQDTAPDEPQQVSEGEGQHADEAQEPRPTPTAGPYDSDEVEGDGVQRIDLGSLRVPPVAGRELRMQVDDASGAVRAVILAGADGALEFQAFAAPRGGDLWAEVRPQLAEDITRRGGTVTEREGRWGTELLCQVPVKRSDGKVGSQPSRIIGVNGARWMLRASLLGRPALEPDEAGEWEDALAAVVVHRGGDPRPVGEALPVTVPDQARRVG